MEATKSQARRELIVTLMNQRMEPTKSQARRELIVAIFLRFYINKSWNQLYQDCLLSIIYYLPLLLEPTQVCDIRALVSLFVFLRRVQLSVCVTESIFFNQGNFCAVQIYRCYTRNYVFLVFAVHIVEYKSSTKFSETLGYF